MLTGIELYVGGVVLVLGAVFTLLAAVGVVRLPDLYTRMHAASKAGAVGGGLILIAVAVRCNTCRGRGDLSVVDHARLRASTCQS